MQVRLEYENGKLVLKCEKDGVTMVIEFVAEAPEENAQERVLDILTAQYQNRVAAQSVKNLLDNFIGMMKLSSRSYILNYSKAKCHIGGNIKGPVFFRQIFRMDDIRKPDPGMVFFFEFIERRRGVFFA